MNILLIFIEGIVMCFALLLVCVIGISNGPVGLVVLYEQDVQDRVVELGYITKKQIRKNYIITSLALFLPIFIVVPLMVYSLNDISNMWDGFFQMSIVMWISGLFDRIFIDWYWVNKTKAWDIKGTEDLKPYIPKKMLLIKWLSTIFVYPLIALLLAFVISLFK